MLIEILEARERRWQFRLQLAKEFGKTVISVTLCAPLNYRRSPCAGDMISAAMDKIISALQAMSIKAWRAGLTNDKDGAAGFVVAAGEAAAIKRICVKIEKLPGGRLFDIDVMSCTGSPVSREDVGLPPRRCFICLSPAAQCVREKKHSAIEVNRAVDELIGLWMSSNA
jgi:holo-ACP synthase CitX